MTLQRYSPSVARQKVTLYLDPVVLRRMRVAAARRGIRDSDLVEQALQEYLGQAAQERIAAANAQQLGAMTDDEALAWAVELQHEVRRESK
jgi:hypothetical protein